MWTYHSRLPVTRHWLTRYQNACHSSPGLHLESSSVNHPELCEIHSTRPLLYVFAFDSGKCFLLLPLLLVRSAECRISTMEMRLNPPCSFLSLPQSQTATIPRTTNLVAVSSGRASFWGACVHRKWKRNLRTKIRKCVTTKRNRETNDAFQKHLYH